MRALRSQTALGFVTRAVILLVVIAVIWHFIGSAYDRALVAIVDGLSPGHIIPRSGSGDITFYVGGTTPILVIDGDALHWGTLLALVIVLAGWGPSPRQVGVAAVATVVGMWLVHLVGLVAIAHAAGSVALGSGARDTVQHTFKALMLAVGVLPVLPVWWRLRAPALAPTSAPE